MLPSRIVVGLVLTAAVLAAAPSLPSTAQTIPAVPDLDPDDCSNGTFVSEPSANPGLAADCRALVAVRNRWATDSNIAQLSWGRGGAGITSWRGVVIVGQRVYALNLDGRGLQGSIPPEISQLTNLTVLDLENNRLTKLPPEISQLTNLTHLNLKYNQLTVLPPELSQLTNLIILDLSGNRLTELPPEIGQLTNLGELQLNGNQLTELPTELSQLTKLRYLHLHRNQLTELPPEISQLTNLIVLDLSVNQLTGPIPTELSQLTKLRYLYLNGNQLTELPPEISRLTNLIVLNLGGNRLADLPPEISRLTNLEILDLNGNQLTGPIPPEISQLTKLEWLGLNGNQLTGPIPTELSRLTKLNRLDLSGNQLTGPIPTELSQLTNFERLNLNGNQLTTLPPEIGQLTNLTRLGLNGNQLTEPIPPELNQLTNLQWLDLSGNQLTEPIPPELNQLTNLQHLYLDSNQTTEPLPPELIKKLWPDFSDDDYSVHEWAIENIARWRITLGCGNGNFCPYASITRSQMAAFLHRAITHRSGEEPDSVPGTTLGDVDEDAWYRPYAQWAAASGVMQAPDGKFDPSGTVTRADMAEMLTAAFDHITPPAQTQGIFTDMAHQPDRVVRAAEALRTAGVTEGCFDDPRRYCPNWPVTRAQMASFFYRALS